MIRVLVAIRLVVSRSRRVLGFVSAGILGACTDLVVFNLLITVTGRNAVALLASNLAAYACGVAVSYIVNRRTFETGGRWARYAVTYTFTGLTSSAALAWLGSVSQTATRTLAWRVELNLTKVLIGLALAAVNYVLLSRWVFRSEDRHHPSLPNA